MDARVRTQLSELSVTLWGGGAFAALLASYSAFRPVRDALILDNKPDQIPWLFLGTFVTISIVSPAWSAILARWSRRRVIPLAYHVFALCAFGFFLAKRADVSPLLFGRVFYIWSAVFNLFVVSVLWSLFADLLGPSTARRLYGPIAAGGTVGTLVGPLLTRMLVGTIGVAGVLLISAVLLEIALVCIAGVRRAGERLAQSDAARDDADPDAPSGGGAFTGIARVAKSPYLSAIVGYVLCTACASTFIYLRQFNIVREAIRDPALSTEYFATIDVWLAIATLAFQTLLVRPALGWVGPGIVLLVLPLAQLIGLSVLVLAPSLTALAIVQVFSRSATHGLTRPARELLFTVVSRDDKYRAKHAIDTIAYRFGDVASSWLNTALLAIGGGFALLGAMVPLAAVWLGLAFVLGAGFRRRVTPRAAPPEAT